jgi:uncharacterized protein (DUF39 family)
MGLCCFRSAISIETEKSIPVSVARTVTPLSHTFVKNKAIVHPLVNYRVSSDRSAINQLDGWIRRMQSVKDEDVKCAIN